MTELEDFFENSNAITKELNKNLKAIKDSDENYKSNNIKF
jgi:hypothetical protein